MEMANVGIYTIDVNRCEWFKESAHLEKPKPLTIFRVLSSSKAGNLRLAAALSGGTRKQDFPYIHRLPYFVLFVTLAEIIVHFAAGDGLKRTLIYDSEKEEQIWRYITYMFIHTDPVHLGLNLIIQALVGAPLEAEQGRARCATIYFCGGLAGSFGAAAFPDVSLMAGASGGVYALLLSHLPNTILNYATIKHGGYRIVAVVALTLSDVIYVLCHVHLCDNERPRIGWVAHASGGAGGILLGFLIFEGTSKWKRKFQVVSCILLLIGCVLGVTRIVYFDYFVENSSSRSWREV